MGPSENRTGRENIKVLSFPKSAQGILPLPLELPHLRPGEPAMRAALLSNMIGMIAAAPAGYVRDFVVLAERRSTF